MPPNQHFQVVHRCPKCRHHRHYLAAKSLCGQFCRSLPVGKVGLPLQIFPQIADLSQQPSDLPVVRTAADTLQSFGVPYEMHVYSAHRTPVQARDFALGARNNGFGVIIAAAGMAAHLAGALAANTTLPVIGIPMKSTTCSNGIDALLSTVQMPSGIPVATVAVDGAANAALLSIQILAVTEPELAAKLDAKRAADAEKVLEKDAALQ